MKIATKPDTSWNAPSAQVDPNEFNRFPKLSVALICITSLAFAVAIFWSSKAIMLEVAVAQGRVIPASKVQLVQNLEGGIINAINVSEGTRVTKDDILVEIDPTSTDSSLGERLQHIASLKAGREWLLALVEKREPEYEAEFTSRFPELVERGIAQFRAKTEELQAQNVNLTEQVKQKELELKSLRSRLVNFKLQLENATEQFTMLSGLFGEKAASRSEVLSAESRMLELRTSVDETENLIPGVIAAISEIESKRVEIQARSRAEVAEKLNDVSVKLNALKSAAIADEDRIERTKVRSPVDGIVKTLHANTLGQIVKPGESILEIVPVGENLLVQTSVLPNDIAFIYPDQPAVIKITAYDSTIFGSLKGVVKRIAADSIVDENGNAFYTVDIQADASHLEKDDKKFPVIPGMVAQVEIITGEKSVLDYITKPIHRTATTAFREK